MVTAPPVRTGLRERIVGLFSASFRKVLGGQARIYGNTKQKIGTGKPQEHSRNRGRLNEEVPTNVSCGTMVQEANASGKARGYADVDPAVRKVENE
jgi:hypothetical protein